MNKSSGKVKEKLEEETNVKWSDEEKVSLPPKYGCQILLEKATWTQLKDPSYPNDAYIVTYQVDGEKYMDLCRGTRVRVFDLYYDKFGTGSVLNIDWGYGRANPKIWGSNQKEKKRRK